MQNKHQMPPLSEKYLFDLDDVAYLTSLSRAEVEREIARGTLQSVKRGRRRLVTRGQLTEYIERLTKGA